MRRGDIWYVGLDPVRGSEANKTRPVVVVSNDSLNRAAERLGLGVVTVVPLTSNTTRVPSFQVLVPATRRTGLQADSKAQVEQLRAIDVVRFIERAGALDPEQMAAVDEALLLHLALG